MNAPTKVTYLGGGHMAWELIQGPLRHGVATSQLCVAEPLATQRARLPAELGIVAVADNDVATRGAAIVVLAVMAFAATTQRLEGSTAEMLAMQALRGTGARAMVDGCLDAAAQRAAVTSPGATTAAALETLAFGGFDKLVAAAVGAAVTRGAELAALGGRREQFAPPE